MPEEPNTPQTEATPETPPVAESVARAADVPNHQETQGDSVAELARLRALVIAAHPDAVPELIQGDTLDALEASVATARDVHARLTGQAPPAAPPAVPAGAQAPADYTALSPSAKIAEGLRQR